MNAAPGGARHIGHGVPDRATGLARCFGEFGKRGRHQLQGLIWQALEIVGQFAEFDLAIVLPIMTCLSSWLQDRVFPGE